MDNPKDSWSEFFVDLAELISEYAQAIVAFILGLFI